MQYDGAVVINTKIDTAGFGKGVSNIKGQLSSFSGIVKKIGSVVGAAFSVAALVNFGKQAVELGSDLQEVQNVVDVTFSTMSDKVNQFAKDAAAAAGLSETMAKKYVGTFGAMSKSFGFAEQEAFDMSTSLTQLAGDVASFYNLTQDEAYTKLKSVFTGETETLKDLGVVMTQTALDSFAMAKGYGKTTDAMSEQEKVALRYQFVMDKLSGASGDFLRTSDSWANQTRILKLQVESFMATIGQGLINLLTPVIKLMNEFLVVMQNVASEFKNWTDSLVGTSGKASENIADASNGMGNLASSTEKAEAAAKSMKNNLSGLDEINTFDSGKSADSASATGAVAAITPAINTTGASGATAAVEGLVDRILAAMRTLQTALEPITTDISLMFGRIEDSTAKWTKGLDLTSVILAFNSLYASLLPIITVLTDSLAWVWEDILLPLSSWTINEAAPSLLDMLANAFVYIGNAVAPVVGGIKDLWAKLTPLVSWIGGTAVGIIEKLSQYFANLGNVFSEKGGKIKEIFSGIGDVIVALWKKAEPRFNLLKSLAFSVFDYLSTHIGNLVGFVIDVLHGLVEFVSGVFTGDWSRAWDGVKKIAAGAREFFSKAVNGIKKLFQGLGDALKVPVNGMIGMMNKMISGICDALNGVIKVLNKLSFDVPDWVPGIGGKKFGFNIKTITAPKIPKLATGAVIPPNAPFYAMLGDQKHGQNLEMPEDLLRKIVREETAKNGQGGNTYEFIAQLNRRTLFQEIIKEGNSELIRTGANPFALGKIRY